MAGPTLNDYFYHFAMQTAPMAWPKIFIIYVLTQTAADV